MVCVEVCRAAVCSDYTDRVLQCVRRVMHVGHLEAIQAHVKHVYTQVHNRKQVNVRGGLGVQQGYFGPKIHEMTPILKYQL